VKSPGTAHVVSARRQFSNASEILLRRNDVAGSLECTELARGKRPTDALPPVTVTQFDLQQKFKLRISHCVHFASSTNYALSSSETETLEFWFDTVSQKRVPP